MAKKEQFSSQILLLQRAEHELDITRLMARFQNRPHRHCDKVIIIYVPIGLFIIMENRQFCPFTKPQKWVPVGIIALLITPDFVHILLRQIAPFLSAEFIGMNHGVSGLGISANQSEIRDCF